MQLMKCKNGWLVAETKYPDFDDCTYFASLHTAADALEPSTAAPITGGTPQSAVPGSPAEGPGPQSAGSPEAPKRGRGRPPKAASATAAGIAHPEPSNADPGDQHPLPLPVSTSPQPVAAPAPAPTPQAAAPTPPAAGASGSKLTLDDARTALGALNSKHGLVMAKGALSRFGCQRISEVKPEQFADFIALCKKGVETGEV